MRKIKIFEHISLDGVIQHEIDDNFKHEGWTTPYRTPAGLEALMDLQGNNFDLLLGRRTYDLWSRFWPTAGDFPMANSLNAATKYVVTHRPESLEWLPHNALGSDFIESLRNLKSTVGPDLILWGSSTLTSIILTEGLVDEVMLLVYPILLGQGKRFFDVTADATKFEFISSTTSPTGVLLNRYKYVGALGK